jgi:hypothetical protein
VVTATLRLRPFKRWVALGLSDVCFIVTGEIERDSFVVTTLAQRFEIPIREAATDPLGVYVLLDEGEYKTDAAVLELTPEYDEFTEGVGAQISIGFGEDMRDRATTELRRQGIDPDTVIALGPRWSRGLSVYFDSDGNVDASGSISPAMRQP